MTDDLNLYKIGGTKGETEDEQYAVTRYYAVDASEHEVADALQTIQQEQGTARPDTFKQYMEDNGYTVIALNTPIPMHTLEHTGDSQ